MEQLLPILVAILAGLAVLLIFMGLATSSDVSARLEQYAASTSASATDAKQRQNLGDLIQSSAKMASFNRVVERRDWGANLARELARADISLKPSEFLAIRVGLIVAIPAAMFALSPIVAGLGNPIAWTVGVAAGFLVPRIWLGVRKARRLKAFNSALADTITLLANSLRAGSSFLQSIELVVRESQPPISTEFGRVIREVNLGLSLEQALANMNRRVRSDDLDLMTTAIIIQAQVGGNLAEILDSIAFTIRERVRIKGEIKTLTAQGRLSGYVVGLMPIGLVLFLSVSSPNFMAPMFGDPTVLGIPVGMILLGFGAVMMALGFLSIRKIVDIEV